MAILNPSFEDPGTLAGQAANWTLTAVTSLQIIAGFGTAPEDPFDGFERWYTLFTSLDDVPTNIGFFNGDVDGREAFESGWLSDPYIPDLASAATENAVFNGLDPIENFSVNWSNNTYYTNWTAVPASAATFGGSNPESFSAQWRSNESYMTSWAGVTSSAAMFNAGANAFETFSGTWTLL